MLEQSFWSHAEVYIPRDVAIVVLLPFCLHCAFCCDVHFVFKVIFALHVFYERSYARDHIIWGQVNQIGCQHCSDDFLTIMLVHICQSYKAMAVWCAILLEFRCECHGLSKPCISAHHFVVVSKIITARVDVAT